MANNGKRMVKEDLLNYLEEVQTNYPDPSDIGGGTDFTPIDDLEFTEVEGEKYLGLTKTAVDVLYGDLRQNRSAAINFHLTDATKAALSFEDQNNYIQFKNTYYEGGCFGYMRETALVQPQFYFTNYWDGGRNKIVLPNTHTTEADKTIALGAKVGDTTVYANDKGIIELPSGGGGGSYSAGTGIDITNNTISIDSTVVALKSDIPSLTDYATQAWVRNQGYSTFSGSYNDLTNKPTIPDAVSGTNDGTNWTSLTIGSDTYNIPSGGGGGTGPTITKYNTSSDMTYTNWRADDRNCTIRDGYPGSNEFIIGNTNPGDILLFDVSLNYYFKDVLYSNRYTLKIVVPIKSPDSLSYADSYKSTAYEFYNEDATKCARGFIKLEIANRSDTTSSRQQIGNIYIPVAITTTDSRNNITVNSITHIAF